MSLLQSVPHIGVCVLSALSCILLCGCGTVRETLTARSATEQMLLSTAVDRAVAALPRAPFRGRRVHLDTTQLECLDKGYVIQRLRNTLAGAGARIVSAPSDADLTLEVASGALSLNRRDYLLGVPSLPLPIPFSGEMLRLPELPLWKLLTYRGRAKLVVTALDPESKTSPFELPTCYGESRDSYIWVLIMGPFRNSNLPPEER